MNVRVVSVVLAAAAALSTGCNNSQRQTVQVAHSEQVIDKVDSQWWTRRISDTNGQIKAIELVYCPLQAGQPTVCRTAVIWEAKKSQLVPTTPPPGPGTRPR